MDNKVNITETNFTIRFAFAEDVPVILQFIKALAEHVGSGSEVVATEDLLHYWIFEKNKAEVFISELNGDPIGFALFFHNFSTFLGRSGIYLEDFYVKPSMRGKGVGKMMMKRLAKLAVERGCGRLELGCLDRNHPSVSFYLSLGAEPLNDWTVYRFSGDRLNSLINS